MKQEIERKYLVDVAKLPVDLRWELVRQGYLGFDPQVRVRVWRGGADITVKGSGTLVRDEWVHEIPLADAHELLKLCEPHIIEKDRALITVGNKEWNIDRFHDIHEGLITAEVELEREGEPVTLPLWITKEVTGDEQYLNINLVRNQRATKN